jgi:ABC-type molybdate transport system ATPase subunit
MADNILHPYRINPALRLSKTVRQRLERLAEELGIRDKLTQPVTALSQGERQRAAICRAVLPSPALILADEPLAALDDARKAEILPYFERLRDHTRVPILFVTHSMAEVVRLATTVVALRQGRLVYDGPSSGLDAQRLKQLYGAQHQELTGQEALGQAPELAQPWVAAA